LSPQLVVIVFLFGFGVLGFGLSGICQSGSGDRTFLTFLFLQLQAARDLDFLY